MKKIFMRSRNQVAEVGKIDPNGFLRIKLRLGSLGVMEYGKEEIVSEIASQKKFENKDTLKVLRDETSIFQPESMQSIEGIPILAYVHEWVIPDNARPKDSDTNTIPDTTPKRSQVGQVAGIAMREGNFLVGNALITDQNVIDQIRSRDLIEISPAYMHEIYDMQGTWNRKKYDLVQGPAYYNHILLLPPDQARAGRNLKILNQKRNKGDSMGDPEKKIGVSTPEGVIFVTPESQTALEKFVQTHQKATDQLAKNLEKISDLDGTLEKVKKLKEENTKLKQENEKQKGEVEAVKAELDTATSPEAIEAMVEEMIETDTVIEAIGEPALQADTKGNRAADKRRKVVKYYLEKQGRKVDDKKLTDGYVEGAWNIVSDSMLQAAKKQDQNNVPVAKIFDTKTQNNNVRTPAQILGYDKKREA